MRSSYIDNNYGNVFRSLILAHRPQIVVECGVLDGYSTFNISHALRFNYDKRGVGSNFIAYDIWENYDYKHGDFSTVATQLRKSGLLDKYVTLMYGDAFDSVGNFNDLSVDFLHMDISNDGLILEKTIEYWGPKMRIGGIIAFEGGSPERDAIEWMIKHKRQPISTTIVKIEAMEEWDVQIFTAFPSMTLFFKR